VPTIKISGAGGKGGGQPKEPTLKQREASATATMQSWIDMSAAQRQSQERLHRSVQRDIEKYDRELAKDARNAVRNLRSSQVIMGPDGPMSQLTPQQLRRLKTAADAEDRARLRSLREQQRADQERERAARAEATQTRRAAAQDRSAYRKKQAAAAVTMQSWINADRDRAKQEAQPTEDGGGRGGGRGSGRMGLLAAMLPLPPQARLILELIAGAVEAPMLPGQLTRGVLGMAAPYTEMATSAYEFARRMGIGGKGIAKGFFPGGGSTQGLEWMKALRLTPEKAMAGLQAYGIAPASSVDLLRRMPEVFERANLSRGLSGMGPTIAQEIARQGAGYGLAKNTPGGAQGYLSGFTGIMERAQAMGMDRSKVLGNIEASIDMLAKTGALGISQTSVLGLFSRFMAAGTPGGRTGETAATALAGMQATTGNIYGNSIASWALTSQLPKYDMLRTEKGVRNMVGEQAWNAIDPGVRGRVVKDITAAAKAGNYPLAINLATSQLMSANPARIAEVTAPAIPSMTGGQSYLNATIQGMVTGMGTRAAYQYAAGGGVNQAGKYGYKANIDYKSMMAGVPAELVAKFIAAGQKYNLDPLLLSRVAQVESNFDVRAKNRKTGAFGLMQLMPSNLSAYPGAGASAQANIDAGADILSKYLQDSGGDLSAALTRYGGFRTKDPTSYINKITDSYARSQGMSSRFDMTNAPSLPPGVAGPELQAYESTLSGAKTALENFTPAVVAATSALGNFLRTLQNKAAPETRWQGGARHLAGPQAQHQ